MSNSLLYDQKERIRSPQKSGCFWRRYLATLHREGIPEGRHRYYVKWVEGALKEVEAIEKLSSGELERHLQLLFDQNLEGWRLRQAVEAIALAVMRTARLLWGTDFDWEHWKALARQVERDHPSRLRREVLISGPWRDRQKASRTPQPCEHKAMGVAERMVRERCRAMDYSPRTENGYAKWSAHYVRYCFRVMGGKKAVRNPFSVGEFLQYLAVVRNVSPSTQKNALNALAFFFRQCLGQGEVDFGNFTRATPRQHLPVVMSQEEVFSVLNGLKDPWKLMAQLMYGSGLRVSEAARLRVKDLDLERGQIVLRDTKGGRERVVPLPRTLRPKIEIQLTEVRNLHQRDRERNTGEVFLPYALERKYKGAAQSLPWKMVVPCCRAHQGAEHG